jgi:hypothetical protein
MGLVLPEYYTAGGRRVRVSRQQSAARLDSTILQSFKCRRDQIKPVFDNLFFLKTRATLTILRYPH